MKQITSRIVPILRDNIDTDQIIPARFLKATDRVGFGENLFRDWRYDEDGAEVKNFELNNDQFSGRILLAGENFGCGSSREHAAWAIADYGFRVVIAKSFADIFRGNALNNGVLPLQVSEEFYDELVLELREDAKLSVAINVEQQRIIILSSGEHTTFDIPPFKKECLINGLDDLDYLIGMREEIEEKLLIETI